MGTALSARDFLQAFRQNFQPMLSTPDAFVDYMILVVDPDGEQGIVARTVDDICTCVSDLGGHTGDADSRNM
jgi:hypothetical protein